MPYKISTGICIVATLAFGLVVSALPAYAGFEWVAPPDGSAPQSAQSSYGTPSARATSGPEVISPVIISGNGAPPMQAAPSSYGGSYGGPSYTPDVGAQPPAQPPAGMLAPPPSSMANATLSLPASSGEIVQGFASQVPLSLALRQILPVGYNFSIDQDIDMNTLVSYKGGKSWRETLRDMLGPVSLVAHEQGPTITVSRMGAAPVAAAPAPAMRYASPAAAYDDGSMVSMAPANHTVSASSSMRMADIPSINVGSSDGWSAERGETLRKVLTDWCKRSGVELQWLAEYDYPMEASAHFSGGFEDAVRQLLAGFENARPQPIAELHTNASAGQMLLVVQARGNNYSN